MTGDACFGGFMDEWSLVVAVLSLLVAVGSGIWAVTTSRSAQRESKEASELAKTANQLSTESNTIARGSQGIAVEANQISEEALAVARRSDLRESDTSDVHWEGDWVEPGLYKLTNRGNDEARAVRIVFTVDEEVVRVNEESVPGGGSVTIDCPEARHCFAGELREYRRQVRAYNAPSSHPFGINTAILPTGLEFGYHRIRERIDWVSEQGKPGVHDQRSGPGYLGDLS